MTLPTDFDSFASGWNFNSAGYSTPGSGGGTWSNLVSGQGVATRGSVTPSFSTYGGVEGCNFSGAANEKITIDWPYGAECTIVITCTVTSFAAVRYLIGAIANSNWAVWMHSGGQVRPLFANLATGFFTTAQATVNTAFVTAISYSPMERKVYGQLNKNSVESATNATQNPYFPSYLTVGIGETATGYFTGNIARVLIFNRALHYRDNTNLQALITTECANIGV